MSSTLRRFLAIGVFVLCALTMGELLRAYALVGVTWGTSTVRYYVNPRSKWVSESAAISAVQTAAATWNASAANIELVYSGTTTGTTVGMNYKSEVIFRDASNGSSAGSGYYWYDGTGKIVDGDVVVWEGAYQTFAGSGCYNGIYIENLVAHELGHTLGLAHSGVGVATMYPTMQGWCDRSWLTLDADDIAGLEKAYPPLSGGGGGGGTTTNTAPSVSISSPTGGSSYSTTSAITFSATATDSQDGSVTSNLNWTSNLMGTIGTSGSFSRTLTAGTHVITAVVTDSGGMVGSRQVTISVTTTAEPAPPPPPPSGGATLTVNAYKVRGLQTVGLNWGGLSASLVDLYRNGSRLLTVSNSGSWVDSLNTKGGGSYSYKVCVAGTSTCTNTATASF